MILPRFIYHWPAEWSELWAERAAIMEIENGWSRERAAKEAEMDIRKLAKNQATPADQG